MFQVSNDFLWGGTKRTQLELWEHHLYFFSIICKPRSSKTFFLIKIWVCYGLLKEAWDTTNTSTTYQLVQFFCSKKDANKEP